MELIDIERLRRVLGGEKTPLHRSTIFKAVKAGNLPKPIKVGKSNRWILSEVNAWLQARAKERDAA